MDALLETIEDELFSGSFDTIGTFIERKQAVAHAHRYAILYLVWDNNEMGRQDILTRTGLSEEALDGTLRPLLDTNLLARVSGPTGSRSPKTRYRITRLGADEIEGDVDKLD